MIADSFSEYNTNWDIGFRNEDVECIPSPYDDD